jgi:zinc D-Ala-D-Ala dipeptidase
MAVKQRIQRWVIQCVIVAALLLFPGLAMAAGTVQSATSPATSPAASAPAPLAKNSLPDKTKLVDLRQVDPRIRLDIRYATTNNFTHSQLYPQARCILHGSIAQALSQVQTDLAAQGLGLKVYDCYRPLAVQSQMWNRVLDERYVAPPSRGSRHNRGAAVDITLVDRTGKELPMPTDFDDFTEQAWRDSTGGPAGARHNSQTLELAMVKQGFVPLPTEWWHFDGAGWDQFPLMDIPFESVEGIR